MSRPRIAKRVLGAADSATLATKAEADRLRASGVDLTDLGLGEPDFDTPAHIKDAAVQALRDNRTHYTSVAGIAELRRAIAERYARLHGASYAPEQVLVGSGAKGVLFALCQALVEEGDEVVVFAPYWVSYPEQIRLAGGVPVFVRTKEEDGFAPTAAGLERALTPRTRAVVVNSPCNPTGAVVPRDEWEAIADVARARDLIVLSDEVYESFVYDGERFASGASCQPALEDRLVVVSAVSKSYAMTGWRLGYAAGPRDLIDAAARVQSHDASQASTLSQYAGLAALSGTQEPLAAMLAEYARRRDVAIACLAAVPGLRCARPKGAFYLFPNVTGLYERLGVRTSREVAARLLSEARVVTVPGEGFGAEGYVRISYAAPLAVIREGLARIAALVTSP